MNICVIGMGKIGLPLAVYYAEKDNYVFGIDINSKTVASINLGEAPFPGEIDLDKKLKKVVDSGRLKSTIEFEPVIPNSEVILVIVPLFVDEAGKPDFRALDAVTNEIGCYIKKGSLVIYETTLPIGTTKNRFTPKLEELSKMQEGLDFYVAFSPERVLTGRIFEDLIKYPKIVGGVSEQSGKTAADFYSSNIDFKFREDLEKPNGVWRVENSDAAEFVKLAETTYRDVNIGLANQFAIFAHKTKVDIYQVITAANSQPYSHIHQPGISVGGHCIPIYPRLYLWSDPEASIVSSAREANKGMPEYAVGLIIENLGEITGLKVGVLGITYRPGVKETAFSGAFELIRLLETNGAEVFVDDPLYSPEELRDRELRGLEDKSKIEVLILHTQHSEYNEDFYAKFDSLRLILDGRNSMKSFQTKNGTTHIRLGDGT